MLFCGPCQLLHVHGRAGHLEIYKRSLRIAKIVHGRAGHLEMLIFYCGRLLAVHGRAGHLEMSTGRF